METKLKIGLNNYMEKKRYLGSSVNLFDHNGNCVVGTIPFKSITNLNNSVNLSPSMPKDECIKCIRISEHLTKTIARHHIKYVHIDGYYILHDRDDNMFYFFA
jgi:hypothetical protein